MKEDSNNSPHILNTSANLLGLCFVVLTSLKFLKLEQQSLIDEFTTVAFLLFMGSCLFSFLSIRKLAKRSDFYESVAEYIFLGGLIVLFIATFIIHISSFIYRLLSNHFVKSVALALLTIMCSGAGVCVLTNNLRAKYCSTSLIMRRLIRNCRLAR